MNMKNIRRSRKLQVVHYAQGKRRGQALVEMALVSMVLVVMTMGLIQYGLIYNTQVTLENITRDGARFAAVHGSETSTILNGTSYATDTAIRMYVRQVATGTSVLPADLPDSSILILDRNGNSNPAGSANRTGGLPITITTKYPMNKKIFDWALPGMGRFKSPNLVPTSVTMIIEGQ
ncbi:MAG: pilus assembly protein [Abitibacteriaceae bacterium]|nr:pilus assembly protein [Abditibacteriaceae bacterium]MBV9867689.1 pilus assembly protein [Abditibacteriaceae bacterium]